MMQQMLVGLGALEDPVYVDDVFKTYLYTGTGSAITINNGIDLDGEGGLVWIKARNTGYNHRLFSSPFKNSFASNGGSLSSELTNGVSSSDGGLSAFTSTGFNVGSSDKTNSNQENYVSWSFRKQKGFFDVVTYTGNGTSGRTIAHNLGSRPGMIIVKRTDSSSEWFTANLRADGAQYIFHRLNRSNSRFSTDVIANVADANNIIVDGTSNGGGGSFANLYGGSHYINENNHTYVAYVFAHDDAQFGAGRNESIIKCSSYVGTGNNGLAINVGFEPGWLFLKNTESNSGDWRIMDNKRLNGLNS